MSRPPPVQFATPGVTPDSEKTTWRERVGFAAGTLPFNFGATGISTIAHPIYNIVLGMVISDNIVRTMQSEHALLTMRLIFSGGPALILVGSFYLACKYPLTDNRQREMPPELVARCAGVGGMP